MTVGFLLCRISNEEILLPGGQRTRLRTSTACNAAYGQNPNGAPLATKLDLTTCMMLRMARSAVPLSWCTWGGHRV